MRTDRNIGKAIGVDYEGSDELRARLTRAGLHEGKRQLDRVNGVAGADSSLGGKGPHRPLPRMRRPGKLKLVWINPSMTKPAGRRTNRASLVIVGK